MHLLHNWFYHLTLCFRDNEMYIESRWGREQNCSTTGLRSFETRIAREKRYDLHVATKDFASGKRNETEGSKNRRSYGTDHAAITWAKCYVYTAFSDCQWQTIPLQVTIMKSCKNIAHAYTSDFYNATWSALFLFLFFGLYYKNIYHHFFVSLAEFLLWYIDRNIYNLIIYAIIIFLLNRTLTIIKLYLVLLTA